MYDLIDQTVLYLFEGLFDSLTEHLSIFVNDAQALCAIFMFLHFGIEGYKMLSGDKKLEIMPLLRPFAITMVLIFWPFFIDIMNDMLGIIQEKGKDLSRERIEKVEDLAAQRFAKIDQITNDLILQSHDAETANEEASDDSIFEFGFDLEELTDKLKAMMVLAQAKLRFLLIQVTEYIVITIFQVCVYIIFFLQILFSGILIILGPFSFAFSILPGFRDSYLSWIARYISVGLYTTIAYIIMSIAFVFVQYSLEVEIDILDNVIESEEAFIMYVSYSSGGVNSFIISLIICSFCMLTIPFISTWIINTSGVGSAVGMVFNTSFKGIGKGAKMVPSK